MEIEIHDSQPPLAADDWAELDRRLGRPLIASYRALLAEHNGGTPTPGWFTYQHVRKDQVALRYTRITAFLPAPVQGGQPTFGTSAIAEPFAFSVPLSPLSEAQRGEGGRRSGEGQSRAPGSEPLQDTGGQAARGKTPGLATSLDLLAASPGSAAAPPWSDLVTIAKCDLHDPLRLAISHAAADYGRIFLYDEAKRQSDRAVLTPVADSLAALLAGLHYPLVTQPWMQQIESGDLASLTAWIENGGNFRNRERFTRTSPLEYAVRLHQPALARKLVELGAPVDRALLVAIQQRQLEIAALLATRPLSQKRLEEALAAARLEFPADPLTRQLEARVAGTD